MAKSKELHPVEPKKQTNTKESGETEVVNAPETATPQKRTSRQKKFDQDIDAALKKGDITPEQADVMRKYNDVNPKGTKTIDDIKADLKNNKVLDPETGRFGDPNPNISKRKEYMGATPGKDSSVGQKVKDRMKNMKPPEEGRIRVNKRTGKEEVYGKIKTPEGKIENGWFDMEDADMGHHPIDAVDFWNHGDPEKGIPPGKTLGPRDPKIRDWMNDPNNYELQHYGYNRSMGASSGKRYDPPEIAK